MKLILGSLLILVLTIHADPNPAVKDLPLNVQREIEAYIEHLNGTATDLPSVVKYIGASIVRLMLVAGKQFDKLVEKVQNATDDEEQKEARHELATALHEFLDKNNLDGEDELSKSIVDLPDNIKEEGHKAFDHIIDLVG